MNILFFLIPKNNVAYVYDNFTVKEVLESMQQHTFSCVPMLNMEGKYVGSITEGDLLWGFHNRGETPIELIETKTVMHLPRKRDYEAVNVNASMEDLVSKVKNQNFVPVLDDEKSFIGIITRKSVIDYCYSKMCEMEGQDGNAK
ncbi:MAG TPA: CBS domain-containing protein [Lachnospiraceae bacterium]